jgi:hypothetical protein
VGAAFHPLIERRAALVAVQYRKFPLSFLGGGSSLLSDTIVATLHTASYSPNYDTHQFVSDLSNELAAGSGYSTGGITLTSKTLAYLVGAASQANTWGATYTASTAYAAGALIQVTTGGGTGIFRATAAGTAGGSAPTWPTTVGSTVSDGTVTWMCEGWGTGTNAVFLTWQASTAFAAGWVIRPATANGFLYRAVGAGTTAGTTPTFPTTVGGTVTDGSVTWECIGSGVISFQANNPSWSAATFTGARYVVLSDRQSGTTTTEPLIAVIDYGSGQSGQGGAFTVQFNPEGAVFFFMA